MAVEKIRGRTALVTGASSGLGVDFAAQLAEKGCDLVLVARRRQRLDLLADELKSKHGVQVTVIDMDLTTTDAAQKLFEAITLDRKLEIDILVNNAGFGLFGRFVDIPLERETAMMQLDVVTLVQLTKLFSVDMLARDWGRILQVASTGGYQSTPGYAAYAACKAFVLSFGEAINYELRKTGVSCTVLSPGVTATEFLEVSGQEKNWYHRLTMMDSPTVARIGLDAMLRRKPSIVAGWLNYLNTLTIRLSPRSTATAVAARVMKAD